MLLKYRVRAERELSRYNQLDADGRPLNLRTLLINFDMDTIEMAKDIIAVLEYLTQFMEPQEVEDDYAERIKEAYELLVID